MLEIVVLLHDPLPLQQIFLSRILWSNSQCIFESCLGLEEHSTPNPWHYYSCSYFNIGFLWWNIVIGSHQIQHPCDLKSSAFDSTVRTTFLQKSGALSRCHFAKLKWAVASRKIQAHETHFYLVNAFLLVKSWILTLAKTKKSYRSRDFCSGIFVTSRMILYFNGKAGLAKICYCLKSSLFQDTIFRMWLDGA